MIDANVDFLLLERLFMKPLNKDKLNQHIKVDIVKYGPQLLKRKLKSLLYKRNKVKVKMLNEFNFQ